MVIDPHQVAGHNGSAWSVFAPAVCLGEALRPEFKAYAHAVLDNARTLAATLVARGVDIVTGSTDTPLMLVDLRRRNLTGAEASESLERTGLTCNKNTVPGDTQSPTVTSGLRFGVSARATRGFRAAKLELIGHLVADLLDALGLRGAAPPNPQIRIRGAVAEITHRSPICGRT